MKRNESEIWRENFVVVFDLIDDNKTYKKRMPIAL
jgi:hypothetical protein